MKHFNVDNSKHESCVVGCETALDQLQILCKMVDSSALDVQTRVSKVCPKDPTKECSAWHGSIKDNPYN